MNTRAGALDFQFGHACTLLDDDYLLNILLKIPRLRAFLRSLSEKLEEKKAIYKQNSVMICMSTGNEQISLEKSHPYV